MPTQDISTNLGISLLGFFCVFAASLGGYAALGPWSFVAAAIALAALSYSEHFSLYRRGQELGLAELLRATTLRSFCNAFLAAGGAYVCGYLLRFI
jgi:hypothetical protein